jgi:streptomycin 6-kinase
VVTLDKVIANKARLAGAQWWIDGLDSLIAELAHEWSFELREQLAGATEACVASVTLADGSGAVLKLVLPHGSDGAMEIAFLERVNGEGCAVLLRSDVARGALLLEMLGPPLSESGLPIATRDEILVSCAARVWRPVEPRLVRDGAHLGNDLARTIVDRWERLNHPCSEAALDQALAAAVRRDAAHDPDRAVLCHGDVHQWNALSSRDGYRLVDPDGICVDPTYDLGVIIRDDPLEIPAARVWHRAYSLARSVGVDPMAVFEWGIIERISTGLLCTEIDLQPIGRELLDVADELAGISAD